MSTFEKIIPREVAMHPRQKGTLGFAPNHVLFASHIAPLLNTRAQHNVQSHEGFDRLTAYSDSIAPNAVEYFERRLAYLQTRLPEEWQKPDATIPVVGMNYRLMKGEQLYGMRQDAIVLDFHPDSSYSEVLQMLTAELASVTGSPEQQCPPSHTTVSLPLAASSLKKSMWSRKALDEYVRHSTEMLKQKDDTSALMLPPKFITA